MTSNINVIKILYPERTIFNGPPARYYYEFTQKNARNLDTL